MMLIHPDVQRKAQEELDKILHHGSVPEFGDRGALPYFVRGFTLLIKLGTYFDVSRMQPGVNRKGLILPPR